MEQLTVFARAPERGKVKTRLCPPLHADEALALHRALVEDSLEHFGKVVRRGLSRVLLLSGPLEKAEDLSVPEGWTTGLQSPGDLGRRLASLFYSSFLRGVKRLIVLGSDSPTLPLEVAHEAFDRLERTDVVLGPAMDGGYYLLGCNRYIPELFENISWGSSEVLAETRKILEALSVRPHLLIPWYDIDRGEDLDKLRQEIAYMRRSSPDIVPQRVAAALPAHTIPDYSLDPDFE